MIWTSVRDLQGGDIVVDELGDMQTVAEIEKVKPKAGTVATATDDLGETILVRWRHGGADAHDPDTFMPVLERITVLEPFTEEMRREIQRRNYGS